MRNNRRGKKSGGWVSFITIVIFLGLIGYSCKDIFLAETETGIAFRVKSLVNETLSQNGSGISIDSIDNMNCQNGKKNIKKEHKCQATARYSDGTESVICIEEVSFYRKKRKNRDSNLAYTRLNAKQCGKGPDFSVSREYR